MSNVTGVILCMSCAEPMSYIDGPPLALGQINLWLSQHGPFRLCLVDEYFGGGKHPQMSVAGGGFNYFPEDDFIKFVIELPWEIPESVVLIVNPEHGPTMVFRPEFKA